jgi:sigma-B regulation protein RsbU (phosphoserine phosphatase)
MQKVQITKVRASSAKSAVEALGFLQRLSRDMADGDAARVLDAVAQIPIECLGVDNTVLLCRSAFDDSWSPIVSRNLPDEFLDNCRHISHPCVLRQAAASQTPIVIEDVSSMSCACACWPFLERVASLACIPVVIPTGPPAVLVCMRSAGNSFAVWEVEFLNTLANHAAAALRMRPPGEPSVILRAETLDVFRDATNCDGDICELLDRLLAGMLAVLRADSGSIMLREENTYRIASCHGLTVGIEDSAHSPRDGSVSSRVIAGRRPIVLHGPVSTRQFPAAVPRTEVFSSASIPLMNRRQMLGLLNINRTTPGALFDDAEFTFACATAHHIAVVIDNARLHDAAKARARYFGNLYQIARTITSTLELDSVLKMILRRLRGLVSHDVCGLALCNNETGELQLVHGHGIRNGDDSEYVELMAPATRLCATRRRPVVIADLRDHPEYRESTVVPKLDLQSAVITPLVVKHEIVGFLAAYRREPQTFSRHTAGLLLGLGELAAIAIENARLYARQAGIARIAHTDLLPPQLGPIHGYEIAGKYAPANQVGGDYYDLIRLDDHRFGLVVADVAGKDISAALHIGMCKHALRALAEHTSSPAKLMRTMNRFIHEHTEPEGFISMFYGLLDVRRHTLTYSTAGHEPGLLHRCGSTEVEQLSTPGIILGIKRDATFEQRMTSITGGDVLLLYTDGLIEALSTERKDGTAVLQRLLAKNHARSAQEIADSIHEAASARLTLRSPDDIAIVTLKKV